ncbi:MAG: PilT/PilU family type 4a pilus ATPase [Deltaproteobacteria bacterium]|nr:MAG: PilT/PilU family type 4a pilus ATPase [Deltaproteobacteria bacterium]
MKELSKRGEVRDQIYNALHQDMLLARLSPNDFELILSSARVFEYNANEYLFTNGDSADTCYLLLSGEVSLVAPFSEAGGYVDVGSLEAPRIIGASDFLLQQERSASVLVKKPSLLLMLQGKSFQELLRRMPMLVYRLCRSMAEMVSMMLQKPALPKLKLKVLDDFNPDVLSILPSHIIQQHQMLPLELDGNLLRVAFVREPTRKVLDALQEVLPGIQPYLFRISKRNFRWILQQHGISAPKSSDGLPAQGEGISPPGTPMAQGGAYGHPQGQGYAPTHAPQPVAQAPSAMDTKLAQELLNALAKQNQSIQQLHLQTQQALQLQAQQNQVMQAQVQQSQAFHAQALQSLQNQLASAPAVGIGGGGSNMSHSAMPSMEIKRIRRKRERLTPEQKRQRLSAILPLLQQMAQVGASDLHLSARQPIRWRLDGDLVEVPNAKVLGEEDVYELLAGMMEDRHLSEFEKREQVDFSYTIEGMARYRVNLFNEANGVSAVLRQIPTHIPSAKDLRLPQSVCDLTGFKQGLVLVTGPTGSGKSTTLAALIDMLNHWKSQHIITLEDPIEFVHESKKSLINQREIGLHANSFGDALRAALREDPDIVLVGELRDRETVSLAIETALTGHLVFGTLHTNNVVSTIDRIIDMFSAEQQNQVRGTLSEVLKGVVSQVLCKQKAGRGRVAAFEVMSVNSAVSNMVRQGKTHQIPTAMSGKNNLLLNQSLEELVRKKIIDEKEAVRRSHDESDMEARLQGLTSGQQRPAIQVTSARRG